MEELAAQMTMLAILVGLAAYLQVRGDRLRDWIKATTADPHRVLWKGVLAFMTLCDAVLIVCGVWLTWIIAAAFQPQPLGLVIAIALSVAGVLHLPAWLKALRVIFCT